MIGVDTVDIDRFRLSMSRSPGLEGRLFSAAERSYCRERPDPIRHLAGTLAAKEAVIKAGRLGSLVVWARRVEIVRDEEGAPQARVQGLSHTPIAVSISHHGPQAVAVAFATETLPRLGPSAAGISPNRQLARFLRPGLEERTDRRLTDAYSTVPGSDFF